MFTRMDTRRGWATCPISIADQCHRTLLCVGSHGFTLRRRTPTCKLPPAMLDRNLTMKYCNACGNPIALRCVHPNERQRNVCTACGLIHYENPKVLVACFAYWNETLLMCRRAQEPAYGQWFPPSGFVEKGETLEQAAVRETFEETGVVIDPSSLELHTVASLPDISEIYISYRTRLAGPVHPRPGIESLEVAMMSAGNVSEGMLAFRNEIGHDYLSEFFHELHCGQFSIYKIQISQGDDVRCNLRAYKLNDPASE